MSVTISEAVKYIGVDDKTIDLFESQYVVPHGVSYNSYLILDEKVALMDTVDTRGVEQWEKNLLAALDGRKVDYLIVSHLEPDHAGSIGRLVELFPEVTWWEMPRHFTCFHSFLTSFRWMRTIKLQWQKESLCLSVPIR